MKILQTLVADEGYTIAKRADNEILGETIALGVHDDPENYVEIEKPEIDNSEGSE